MCRDVKRSFVKCGNSEAARAVTLRYSGLITVQVRGVVTGQLYRFSRLQPAQWVDRQDAPSLLQTQLFREISCQ